jgi:uncharacterized protein (TIGR03118 family)
MRRSFVVLLMAGLAGVFSNQSFADAFHVTTLATNATDPGLINPWGLAASPTGPFWIGANGTGISEIYSGAGVKLPLVVTIPGNGSVTGVEFTGGNGFNGDQFLFASEDGTISGWKPSQGTLAEVLHVANPDDVFKGVASGVLNGHNYAYLANFRQGTIEVMPGDGGAPALISNFLDPGLPAGYAPFNVENLNGTLYVTYALRNAANDEDVPGLGNGIVDRFDLNGNFLGRVVTGGVLDSPWGLALAPTGFGSLDGALLVGNFGDGLIHAYDPITGQLLETLMDESNNPLAIDGLWALQVGNGGNGGNPNTVYFTAAPNDETGGEFGSIFSIDTAVVPEPASFVLVGIGLLTGLLRARHVRSTERSA